MEEFLRDGIWQFIGAFFGFVAIVISIIVYFAQRRNKRLAYEIFSQTSVINTTDEVAGKIQILFEGKPVKKVHLLVIKIANIGNVPITKNDYERAVSLNFSENVQILSNEISSTYPENLKAEIDIIENSIIVKPILLNGGDALTIKTLISEYDEKIVIDGRIVGVKTIENQVRSFVAGKYFVSGVILMGISLLVSWDEFFTSPNLIKDNPVSFILLALGFIIIYTGIIIDTIRNRKGITETILKLLRAP